MTREPGPLVDTDRTVARALAGIGALGISFSAVVVRLANVSPATAAFFRAFYALAPLGLVWWVGRQGDSRSAPLRARAFVAGLFLACDLAAWHRSIGLIGAGLATVLANVQVVFVGVAAWILYGERPSRPSFVLIPMVLVGVILISGLGAPSAYGTDPVLGVSFGVIAGLAYSVFLLLLRSANPGLVPPAGPLLDATAGTAVGSLAFGFFERDFTLAPSWPAHGWLAVLAVGVHATAWLLITRSLPRIAALETSVLLLLQPVFAMVWGLLVFAESPSSPQVVGALLVLGGVTTLSVVGSVAPRTRSP